jgi:two-component SAPR family response regulator
MTQVISTNKKYSIDLSEAIPDITNNVIHDSRFNQLPSDIFEQVIFQALNDLIDDFAQNTDKYWSAEHRSQIESIAHDYLANDPIDKSELQFYFD